MKTLYISDLDGTLLQPDATLSSETIHILNQFIASGKYFSIATARTIASVKHILKDVNIQVPIVLMNGVCVYDLQKDCYIKVNSLESDAIMFLDEKLRSHDLHGFYYGIEHNTLSTSYDLLLHDGMKSFVEERVTRYQKTFDVIPSFSSLSKKPLIYVCLLDAYEKLLPLYQEIEQYPLLNCAFYPDNYSSYYYLEIFHHNASKYHTVRFLKEYGQFDDIVCFGDNRNDLPLFQASDKKYAVANAVDDLKKEADAVIGSNRDDGVVQFLKTLLQPILP